MNSNISDLPRENDLILKL